MASRTGLPIETILPEVVARILRPDGAGRRKNIVIEAPPGAGKTTLVPLALLEAGIQGEVLVLQPRRLAARMAAARVADLLGERLGERIGYQVRFESKISERTQIRFLTEGVLRQRLRHGDELPEVAVVVLDEFHERHLDGDLSLALLRRLQTGSRADLGIIAMSATLDGEPLCRHLDCDSLRVETPVHPIEIVHRTPTRRRGQESIAGAVAGALSDVLEHEAAGGDAIEPGHVLVFLPGMREIRACEDSCAGIASRGGLRLVRLHGELGRDEQDAAVARSERRKLILATNVAETSVTIDGVTTVIDSGLARFARHDPWSGLPRVELGPISQASAVQRTGRAGRTRPGRCVRLYSKHDFDRRPAHDVPEVRRADLSGARLDLAGAGVTDPFDFPWFESPPEAALQAASDCLRRLSAIERSGAITKTGHAMLHHPVHPRLARLMVEGERRGIVELTASVAALLSERSIRRGHRPARHDLDSDVLADLDDLRRLRRQPGSAPRLGIDPSAAARVERTRKHLLGRSHKTGKTTASKDVVAQEHELLRALLLAYPDRVGKVRDEGHDQRTVHLAGGTFAPLDPASVVRSAEWIVAVRVEERRDGGRHRRQVSHASAIDPDWILEEFADDIEDVEEVRFDEVSECVRLRSDLRFEGLVLESSERAPEPEHAFETLSRAAAGAGPARLCDRDEVDGLRNRIVLLSRLGLLDPPLDAEGFDAMLAETIRELCRGRTGFDELRQARPLMVLRGRLGESVARLDDWLPKHVELPGGRRLAVHYEADRDPWIASRLQDFFGMRDAPQLLDGRVPLVLHLRAPNNRDVQVTTDLRNFWTTHYPELRRALMRRYPRHDWPEDPASAQPPAPRSRGSRHKPKR